MKKFLVWILAMGLVAGAAFASPVPKQFRINAGDATNPQTVSMITTYGDYARSWTVVAGGGSGATLKFKGLGGRANWWLYVPDGTAFSMDPNIYPVDSVAVLRDATTGYCYFVGVMGQ